jgi:hypothetical protein
MKTSMSEVVRLSSSAVPLSAGAVALVVAAANVINDATAPTGSSDVVLLVAVTEKDIAEAKRVAIVPRRVVVFVC